MSAAKAEARRLIESLPDDATWDDIMYEMYVKMKIEDGLSALDRGEVVSHDEIKREMSME